MNHDYFEQYHREYTNGEGRAYHAQPRSETPQTSYRYNSRYTPHHVRTDAEPKYTDIYSSSSAYNKNDKKKKKAKISAGSAAAILVVCIMLSGFAGFGGSLLYSRMNASSNNTAVERFASDAADENVITTTSVGQTEKSTSEIVSDVADSVVEITTEIVQTDSYYGQYVAQGAGSGVIISEDGFILTNNHVIDGASSITVTLRSGESYEAQLIGTDADVDIALIKIDASGLTAAAVGDSSTVDVGDKAVIIGNPLGTLGGSVTEGIISAVDRTLEIDGKTMHLMQTDAAVNPGNSGGGMFNGQSELVGIVVAKSSDSTIDNIGFVIPINNALDILEDLKQYGYVRGKASTGMAFTESSNQSYAQYFYGMSDTGVYIASVNPGSNAAAAGFLAGDRVISVDGSEVNSISDLKAIISGHSVGDTLSFELERSGRTGTIELTLEEYAPNASV